MTDMTTQTKTAEITYRQDGILYVRSFPGANQDITEARANIAVCRQLVAGKIVPTLIDIRKPGVLNREARQTYGAASDLIAAIAILVNSAFTRIAANLFIRIGSPSYPVKMFTSEQEAVAWLKGFLR